jgi:hypothetical protein
MLSTFISVVFIFVETCGRVAGQALALLLCWLWVLIDSEICMSIVASHDRA